MDWYNDSMLIDARERFGREDDNNKLPVIKVNPHESFRLPPLRRTLGQHENKIADEQYEIRRFRLDFADLLPQGYLMVIEDRRGLQFADESGYPFMPLEKVGPTTLREMVDFDRGIVKWPVRFNIFFPSISLPQVVHFSPLVSYKNNVLQGVPSFWHGSGGRGFIPEPDPQRLLDQIDPMENLNYFVAYDLWRSDNTGQYGYPLVKSEANLKKYSQFTLEFPPASES